MSKCNGFGRLKGIAGRQRSTTPVPSSPTRTTASSCRSTPSWSGTCTATRTAPPATSSGQREPPRRTGSLRCAIDQSFTHQSMVASSRSTTALARTRESVLNFLMTRVDVHLCSHVLAAHAAFLWDTDDGDGPEGSSSDALGYAGFAAAAAHSSLASATT